MSLVVLLLAVSALYLYLLSLPTFLIGDGREYACGSVLWLKDFTPWHSEADVRACIQEILPGDPHGVHGWERAGNSIESVHFWLITLLAAPFVGIARVARLDILTGWTLFHWALTLFTMWWTRRRVGATAAVCLLLTLAASPLVYWTTKAHSEIFVCLLLALAFVEVWCGNLLWAALFGALASTQQTTLLGVTALPCLAAWAVFRRRLPPQPAALLVATVVVIALSPVYYMLRLGRPALLSWALDPALLSAHRAAALFVDPDIGLLPAWPVGLIFAAICIAAVLFWRTPQLLRVAAGALLIAVIEPLLTSIQINWNNGGTVHILRYGLYLMVGICVAAVAALVTIPQRRARLGAVASFAILLVFFQASWNWPMFFTDQREVYVFHTRFAEWLYKFHPDWYDPIPEVFAERGLHLELAVPTGLPPNVWAIGNEPCTKLLVVRPASQIATPDNPPGCRLPNDSIEVFRAFAAGRIQPTARGYINRPY